MLRNYLKTSWRNLMKNKIFSLINIAGLSIGMAACLLILQYVSFELSYDQFNKNVEDIYRVYNDRFQNGKLIQHGTITYSAIGKAMQDDFPEVVDHTRVEPMGSQIITYQNKKIADLELKFVDNSFTDMFSYPFICGDSRSALVEPNTILLTATTAKKIFSIRENDFASLVGRQVTIGQDSVPYKITGILRDAPENSHLKFDMLASFITLYTGKSSWKEANYDFTDSDFWHYVKLRKGTNYKTLEAKFSLFSERHFQGNKVSGSFEKFYLQPLSRAHLYSDFEYEIGDTASATVVWGLLIIAALIIVIAWINYINLATAKSMERAREVGIRKVSGATKNQLIRQFLTESVIINFIALAVAVVMVLLAQNSFNQLVGHELSLSFLFLRGLNGFSISSGLIVLVAAGIVISGFYPSFILSSFKPVLVLKGKFISTGKGIVLRKALVIGQFAITIALIIGSLVVYRQMRYVSRQNLGINISQMVVVKSPEFTPWDSTFITRENSFSAALSQIPGIVGAANFWNIPGGETGRSFSIRRADQPATTHFTMRHTAISLGYIPLYGLKILAGRDFSPGDFNPDFSKLHNIILNESATRLLGFAAPGDAIGKRIFRGDQKWDIIGVINDYHQKSLRYPIEPTLVMPAYSTSSMISVKVSSTDFPSTIAQIKKYYDEFFPGNLFDFFFLDQRYNQQYANDQLFGKVFAVFSGFAIFIACLGLLGLSLFATAQRTKEIGVRKVLGASVSNIIVLLSRDFVKLVLVSIVIASPIAWFIMNGWLQDFAYRTQMSLWIFLGAGLLAIGIALATISFQAVRAATANPVRSLRSE